jgi:hypothetical protein
MMCCCLQECLSDPSEVSGFITLAKEQTQQQQHMMMQQQQASLLAGNGAPPGLLQLTQLTGNEAGHNVISDDLYDQLSMLAAQRASSPTDGLGIAAAMQQQQQQQFVQMPGVSQGTVLQQWQLPLLQNATQLPLQQQQQPQLAGAWSLGDTDSNSRWLLQQRFADQSSTPQQQQHHAAAAPYGVAAANAAANAGGQPLALLVPVQSNNSAAALSGAQTLLPVSITADGMNASRTATVISGPHLSPVTGNISGISNTNSLQGNAQLLDLAGSSSSSSGSYPSSSSCSVPTLQYVTLLDGQRVLLPVASSSQIVTANVTLAQQGVGSGLSACYMSPQQQQPQQQPMLLMQQQQGAACVQIPSSVQTAASSASSSISSVPNAVAAQHVACMAYAAQQQQQGVQAGMQNMAQVASSSSMVISAPEVSLPLMLQQQQQQQQQQGEVAGASLAAAVAWQQQQQLIQCSEPQMLVNMMQNCSISQQLNDQWV